MKNYILSFLLLGSFLWSYAQEPPTHADSLRGGLRPERTNYKVLKYDLSVEVIPEDKYLIGKNRISFQVKEKLPKIQLDLFKNMTIDSIVYQGEPVSYKRDENAVFINFPSPLKKGTEEKLDFYYSGHPITAKNPPWDGGFIFTKDENGKDWISVAVQGIGASLWYPNKDHQSDKPDEAEIHVTTPKGLMNVSNGRFTGKEELPDGRTTWSWKVTYPINSYNLVLNIGDYQHISDKYEDIDLDYYVMPYNIDKAKRQFREVKDMLACFSDKFGDYPFKRDGYKLIETPYLGMEHQSGIGYGNHYKHGYDGTDISGSSVGMKFDFIIVHESGHEWFGNSVTANDVADMWIHEAFTSYAEAVYVECRWGKKEALKYLTGFRNTKIENKEPIIGKRGIQQAGSGDMYYKGANFLHTLRTVIDNDKKWWKMLKDFQLKFRYQSIDGQDVIDFFNQESGMNLSPIFKQYLNYPNLPELQFKKDKGKVFYRWEADAVNFEMPIRIAISGKTKRITPTKYWQELEVKTSLNRINADTVNSYIRLHILK